MTDRRGERVESGVLPNVPLRGSMHCADHCAAEKHVLFRFGQNVRGARPLKALEKVAGAPGFEPGNGGTKNRCLTAWRRPIGTVPRLHNRRFYLWQPKARL